MHERLVEFPLWDEYADHIKSDIADLSNLGKGEAGHISAAKFLERFAVGYPWIHLDIAGPAFLTAPESYRGKGGTGTGVRLLYTSSFNWYLVRSAWCLGRFAELWKRKISPIPGTRGLAICPANL